MGWDSCRVQCVIPISGDSGVGWDSCRVQCVISISGRQWGGMGQLSCSVCNTNIWETVGWDGTAVVFSV